MKNPSFTTTFSVDQPPEEAFSAINNVRGWWSEEIEGSTGTLGDEFTYRYKDAHYCKLKLVEVIPDEKVVWLVLDNHFNFTEDESEWKDTKITFEVSKKDDKTAVHFTHIGLVPDYECYSVCSNAWGSYINGSLRSLITTGKGRPNPREEKAGHSARAMSFSGAHGATKTEKVEVRIMKKQDFTTAFSVDQTPQEVFDAINNVRGWWSEEIEGDTDKLGAEFKFHYKDFHRSTQKITELMPGKKVVWHVSEPNSTLSKTRPSGMAPTWSSRSPGKATKPNSALRTSAWFLPSNATVTVQAHGAFISTTACGV